jgi:hypothetical protein
MRDAWTHATETFLAELGLPLDGALDIENWPATYWSEKVRCVATALSQEEQQYLYEHL